MTATNCVSKSKKAGLLDFTSLTKTKSHLISSSPSGHQIWKHTPSDHPKCWYSSPIDSNTVIYYATHLDTKHKVHMAVEGIQKNNVLHEKFLRKGDDGTIKAHDLYHHLLKAGHVVAIVGDDHSLGAYNVWLKLSKKKNVNIHGWYLGKPVNIKFGVDFTHSVKFEYDGTVPEYAVSYNKNILDMVLVAHLK